MTGPDMKCDVEIDAVGLLCPLPVLRLQKKLRNLAIGQIALLRSSDPMAVIDVPHFCSQAGVELIKCGKDRGDDFFLVRKLELGVI